MNSQNTGKKLPLSCGKRMLAILMTVAMCLSLLPAAALAAVEFPVYVVGGMGAEGYIQDAKYDELFEGGSAVNGIKAVIAAGNFYINGIAVPKTEAECADGYEVNGAQWLYKNATDNKWYGGKTASESYIEAAYAMAVSLPPGLEAKLSDTNADGKVDKIETEYLEGIIVGTITHGADGYTVVRDAMTAEGEKPYDGAHFTGESGEMIADASFDTAIHEGDMALFWKSSDGWHMKRAEEVNDIFVKGVDHGYYQMGEIQYGDAMKFSRDNVIISNRNGEFSNAQQYFGFANNTEGKKVSLWLVPTVSAQPGAPIGLTSGENASYFLEKAIAAAQEKLDSALASADGTDVEAGAVWTGKAAYDQLQAAITRAQAALDDEKTSDALLDYQIYMLYLVLNGSYQDIGASFAGYKFNGFDHELAVGTKGLIDTVQTRGAAGGSPMAAPITVTDASYNDLFAAESADAGVRAIIAAGNFFVNEFAIPATEAEFLELYPDGYTVNGAKWLYKSDNGWFGGNGGGKQAKASYADAAYGVATDIPAGNELKLYDTNGDGKTDVILASYVEGVIVSAVNANRMTGAKSVVRDTIAVEGEKPFDGGHFTKDSGEMFTPDSVDASIESGDMAVFWYGLSGWKIVRAEEINGILVEGIDHKYYQIDDVQYPDAMRFSRDNVVISNRNGEYSNAQTYFGFTKNTEGKKVSLWLVPSEDPDIVGAPVGLTSGENARYFLGKAIEAAQAKLDSAVVSADGAEVAADKKWVSQAAHDELASAIARAQAALDDEKTSDALMDYQLYLLYLTLHGSADDIGAKFAGYVYNGFDNELHSKSEFSDVAKDAWYYEAVTFAAEKGITFGIDDGKFGPDDNLTRGQLIVMLLRAYGIEPDDKAADNFADAGSTYYTGYLAKAKALGIAVGIGDNKFAPDDSITRQDMFTLLYRALAELEKLPAAAGGKKLADFSDASAVADYAQEAFEVLVAGGIVSGSDGKLAPADNCTRAQTAQIFFNLLGK